jgi:hypothetical protein
MAKVIFGNYSSVLVLRQDRDSIRKFYCDVLGGKIMKRIPKGTSFAWEKTSISGFSMVGRSYRIGRSSEINQQ